MKFSRRTSISCMFLVAVMLLTGACAGAADDTTTTAAPDDAPDWITKLYPAPGAETTATRAVQVGYDPFPADRELRLLIDGTDVTVYAQQSDGLLEYDIDQDAAPVELMPGMHEATVELYSVEVGASEGVDSFSASERAVIDSYTWEFEVS